MTPLGEQIAPVDRALVELGLVRSNQAMQAIWRGQLHTRDCVVRIAPQRRTYYAGEVRYRTTLGYRLRVELQTEVRTQLFFVPEGFARNAVVRWIYKLRRQTAVHTEADAMRGFVAVTIDPAWTRQLLDQADAIRAAARLLNEDASPSMAGSVHIAPTSEMGKVYFASPVLALEQITEARVHAAIADLKTLAIEAERLPAPQVVREVSALGRFSERHPWVIAAAVLLGLMAIVGFGALLLVLTAIGLNAAAR